MFTATAAPAITDQAESDRLTRNRKSRQEQVRMRSRPYSLPGMEGTHDRPA